MFRKAWMKLFLMIVSILLVVFVALITGINMITEAVLNGQSKDILQQIASDLEYNEKDAVFVYTRRDARGEEKSNNPPPKPAESSNSVTSSAPASTSGTEAPSSTEEHTDAEAPTEGSAPTDDPVQDIPQTDPDTQPSEPKTEKNPWLIMPTFPEDSTMPTMANGQQWGGQGWGNTQGWSGTDWSSMQEQYSQYWNNNNGQNWANGKDWSGGQNWGEAFWNQGGSSEGNGGQSSGGGLTWDAPATQEDWKNPEWWKSSSNPYNMWVPNNPMNPMNPDNPWYDKFKDSDKSDTPKSESGDESKYEAYYDAKQYKEEAGQEDTADEPSLVLTAGGEGYELRLLSYSETSATTSKTSNTYDKSSAKSSKVEEIPRKLGSIEYFAIMADKNGKYLATLYNDQISDAKAQKYISPILNDEQDTGMINTYQYYRASKSNGTMLVMTDKTYEEGVFIKVKRVTVVVGLTALIILSVLAYFFSKKSIQPIKIAFDKQKQFVSDASHELKTPLTVISTNADVLEGEIGENKWLNYIKSQTDRMSVLVNDLLNLTRLENSNNELEKRYFNLSKAIANTALPFECQAFESNKKFEVNIEDNIMFNGSEKHIKQMAAIFIDNALKYSNDGGTVQVTLKRSGDKKLFSVYNTGEGIKENDTEKIFERFYRSDESRNRATGGYGLGLAIAKSIVDKHKMKIHVLNQPGKGVCFIVTM